MRLGGWLLSEWLFNGDCLEVMPQLIDRGVKVDLVLCDLPYGTTHCKWDSCIELSKMWENYKGLIKKAHAIVLFAQQPFTSQLISSNYDWYKYNWIWKKDRCPNFMMAKYVPLKETENIVVFSDGGINTNCKNKMIYYPQGLKSFNKKVTSKVKKEGVNLYNCLSGEHIQENTNYPKNILEFPTEKNCVHPTQKPVSLMEYLIRTYTREGDVVLDNCMGSGTTGVACKKLGRNFIGIERDKGYFEIAKSRLLAVGGLD